MGMSENWESFVVLNKNKADSHANVAQYWDTVHTIASLTLIVLAACTTVVALIPQIPSMVTAGLGAITTVVSAITGFMQPANRRQKQMESSKGFRTLQLRMVRCENERDYEELWKEYNKELLGEPFVPLKYQVIANDTFTMAPELVLVIHEKNAEMAVAMGEKVGEKAAEETVLSIEDEPDRKQKESEKEEKKREKKSKDKSKHHKRKHRSVHSSRSITPLASYLPTAPILPTTPIVPQQAPNIENLIGKGDAFQQNTYSAGIKNFGVANFMGDVN